MRNTIWEKKIPTLLGIFLIVIGLGITSYLATKGIIIISKAGPSNTPRDVRVTNVTDSSFTISYRTSDKVLGSINYGKDKKLGTVARDDRDQQNNSLTNFNIHNITVRNLIPNTKYFFSITSGNDTFEEDEYVISTSSKIDSPPSQQEPISGKVIMPEGDNPKEAIIYATIDGAQTISTLAKSDGTYILPLNSVRVSNLENYFQFENNMIKMQAIGDQDLISNAILLLKQISPVPTITLSKNYDFTEGFEPVASESAELQNFPSFAGIKTATKSGSSVEAKIQSPEENEGFSDSQPLFKGTAAPNSTVKIIIHSLEQIEEEITTDRSGNWSYRPSQNLSPGDHTLTIITKDSSGITRTITKSFIVFASGTQVTETATPSATPIPTLALSPSPIIPSPTDVPVPTAPITAAPPLISTPTPTIAPPGSSSAFGYGLIGLSISIFGGFLLLLTQKKAFI